jgi:hypothetical protein
LLVARVRFLQLQKVFRVQVIQLTLVIFELEIGLFAHRCQLTLVLQELFIVFLLQFALFGPYCLLALLLDKFDLLLVVLL